MFPIQIIGLGSYLPERRVANDELADRLGIAPEWIARATGVHERRYASDAESALAMGARAAADALGRAGIAVADLDAVVGASAGPHQTIPCTAALIAQELGLADGRAACFDLNATCLSFLVALHTVAALITAGVYRTVLIVSSERASRSLNPQERESAVLFGDAAAAAIVTAAPPDAGAGVWGARFVTHPSGVAHTVLLGGGTGYHPNDPATTPEMNMFRMDGPRVYRQGAKLIGPFLDDFLRSVGWERASLAALVPHQASRHALDLLTERLSFTREQVINNIALRGNCVAASLPLALVEAVQAERIRRGDRVLLGGSGAGLTLGALALTY
jgi:3-oxoacyl-[acyl-carrier-protein] synthase-3